MTAPGDVVIVAVSGGPDSLALLHILHRLRPAPYGALHVAHLDHRLRGAESADDAAFVERTAAGWGLPATIASADVASAARARHANLHQAAREARYRFLADVAAVAGASAVAVAHNADDQAETVLMHLLRGAGIAGLRGMLPVTDFRFSIFDIGSADDHDDPKSKIQNLTLIRPLLGVTRAEIEAYCAEHGLHPRRDATNEDPAYTRNRIRHDLLPRLAEYNPNVVAALGQTAALCAGDYDALRQALDALWPDLVRHRARGLEFDGAAWRALHPALQRAAIRRAHRMAGGTGTLSLERVEAARRAVDRGVGRHVELAGGVALRVGYGGAFSIGEVEPPAGPQLALDEATLAVPGELAMGDWRLVASLEESPAEARESRWEVALDAAAVGAPLLVRRRRPGDLLRPAGAPGRRRLHDVLVDAKIPRELRDAWPIVLSGETIVWVPGARAAEGFLAGKSTRRWVRIRVERRDVVR